MRVPARKGFGKNSAFALDALASPKQTEDGKSPGLGVWEHFNKEQRKQNRTVWSFEQAVPCFVLKSFINSLLAYCS